ncbi:MAG: LysR family transcriptional regulator [Burkholderiales bacterium]
MNTTGSFARGAFDWALVRSFLAVVDTGSLLAASRRLATTQPTVGRHIEAFEAQLGKILFERTGRGMTPTADARSIAGHARAMQAGADGLAQAVTGSDRTVTGLVRVSASVTLAQHLLPAMVAQLQVEAPDIDIAIVASDEVSNLLRRDADIAIRMVRPGQSSLIARRLGEFKILPCASRHYLDRFGVPRTPTDLASHRMVGSDRDPSFHRQLAHIACRGYPCGWSCIGKFARTRAFAPYSTRSRAC